MWKHIVIGSSRTSHHLQRVRSANFIRVSRRCYLKGRDTAQIAGLVVNGNAAKGRGLKNVIKTTLASLATAVGVYTAVQIYQGKPTLFVPLWVDNNLFWRSKYRFPVDIKYFDQAYYDHIQREIELESKAGRDYAQVFEEENIKYKVLEELSRNRALRKHLQMPVHLHTHQYLQYEIWLECPHPAVWGIEVPWKHIFQARWVLRPIDIWSVVEGSLVAAGLKLDRLQQCDANRKTHEKALGKIHEVPITEGQEMDTVLNGKKKYQVLFKGSFVVNSAAEETVRYCGSIDFDHVMINRGVKLNGLSVEREEDGEVLTIKVV